MKPEDVRSIATAGASTPRTFSETESFRTLHAEELAFDRIAAPVAASAIAGPCAATKRRMKGD